MERRVERLTLAGATSCKKLYGYRLCRGKQKNTKTAGYKMSGFLHCQPEDVRSGMYLANKGPCRAKVSHQATEPHLLAAKKATTKRRRENQTARWESETVPNK